jgi:hypothetical protein
VQVLGRLDSAHAARALAVLAVFGKSGQVRRAATETLARRNPRDYADLLIGLLRDPIAYHVEPVGGPGLPGRLTVQAPGVMLERIYAPPPPPNLAIFPGESVTFDGQGLPVLNRHTDSTGLPFAWQSRSGVLFPSRCILPPHVPVVIALGQMWLENWRSARFAQQQLLGDAAVVEQTNERIQAVNEHIAGVLRQATGERLPAEREAWNLWWSGRARGQDAARPVVTQVVPLNVLPRNVGGLGFDPVAGAYFVIASTFGFGG